MNKTTSLAATGGLLVLSVGASASTIYSSSFEAADGQAIPPVNSFITYNAGDPAFGGGWNVDGVPGQTGIDLVNQSIIPAADGDNWVDLVGTPGPGGIDRLFHQDAGLTYTLTWQDFGDAGDSYNVVFGDATLNGQLGSTNGWATRSLTYTASTTGDAVLSYFSPDGGNGNLGLDAVNIAAVPEPTTIAALGLGAIVLVRRRRTKR